MRGKRRLKSITPKRPAGRPSRESGADEAKGEEKTMTKFHCIGMKDTQGKGLDGPHSKDYNPESHAAGLLYLEKAEAKAAKMSRKRFLELWDRELIKLGDYKYNKYPHGPAAEREAMAFAYLAGRNGETYGRKYRDSYVQGECDRIAPLSMRLEVNDKMRVRTSA